MRGQLEQLHDRAAKIQGRLDEIETAAAARSGDDAGMTDDELVEYERGVADLGKVKKQISAVEARKAADVSDWLRRRKLPGPGALAEGAVAEFDDGARIESLENPNGPFRTFGDQLAAIAAAAMPGGKVDDRLYKVAAASGMSSAVGADGAFLVQKDFTTVLLEKAEEQAVLWPRCFPIPIGANSDGFEAPIVNETSRATGSRWGGVRVYRKGEADTVAASKPGLDKLSIDLEDLMGLMYATDRLVRDASQLTAFANKAFSSEMAFVVDDEIIRGTGVGQCLGLLNSAALVSVAKEGSQAADTVVAGNVVKMYARMPARLLGGSVFIYNSEVFPQLMLMTVGQQPVFIAPGGLAGSPYGALLGRPAIPVEQCAALGDLGDIFFVNLDEYVVCTKDGIQAAESMHVRFIYNERTFRWNLRLNGAPGWKSSIAAYKGTGAKSPFIALAERA